MLISSKSKPLIIQPVPVGDEFLVISPIIGDTVIVDKSKHNVPLINNGVIITEESPIEGTGSIYFNGTQLKTIRIPYDKIPELTASSFKIEYWMKPIRFSGVCTLFAQWVQIANRGKFILTVDGLLYWYNDNNSVILNASRNVIMNEWHHYCLTKIGNNFTLSIDGVVVVSTVNPNHRSNVSTDLTIGGYFSSVNNLNVGSPFEAYLSDIRMSIL